MKKLALILLLPSIALAHNVSRNIDIIDLKNSSFPAEIKRDIQAYNRDIKIKGFFENENPYIRKIMKMREDKKYKLNITQAESNELKESYKEIKTNFTFNPVLPNSIYYSGIGILNNDVWSGIKEFFDGKEIGMCSLSVFNISNIKEHIQLNREGLSYEVNDKPTRITIEGSQNSGFMYSVRWYEKNFVREIECANNNFDNSIKYKIIEYAKIVDNSPREDADIFNRE